MVVSKGDCPLHEVIKTKIKSTTKIFMTEVFMKIEFADIKNKQGTTRNLNIYYTLYFKISTLAH
jgi:hypothetical protein